MTVLAASDARNAEDTDGSPGSAALRVEAAFCGGHAGEVAGRADPRSPSRFGSGGALGEGWLDVGGSSGSADGGRGLEHQAAPSVPNVWTSSRGSAGSCGLTRTRYCQPPAVMPSANMARRPSLQRVMSKTLNFSGEDVEINYEDDGWNRQQSAKSSAQAGDQVQGSVFADVEAMKRQIRENLTKTPYDVAKYYKKDGVWRSIATNFLFGNITLAVIAVNAVWIGVDTDHNSAEVLSEAAPLFQIAEHCFCLFFSFEWSCRFMSFATKINGLRDGWFVFDSVLVFMMVLETWVFTAVMLATGSGAGGGLGNASILRMARLARLSRMARMARLLRAMPELMILIKGIAAATRSVCFTLCLLCILLYIFAIAFTQLTTDTDVGREFFGSVSKSMYSLLICGTLMDNIGVPLRRLAEEGVVVVGLYLVFVLLATVTVMNMLIGVLCEVVSTVAAVEKETLMVTFVRDRLQKVMAALDEDGSGRISQDEFVKVMESREALQALSEVGVDVEGLVDFQDFIFADDSDDSEAKEGGLTFSEFMNVVLQFRGTNGATVKDVVELHKYTKQRLQEARADILEVRGLVLSLPCSDHGSGSGGPQRKRRNASMASSKSSRKDKRRSSEKRGGTS